MIAAELGEWAAGARYEELPAELRELLPSLVLDQLACQVVGATIPHNALVREHAFETAAGGRATVVGGGDRTLCAEGAALANATAGHGFEMDDTHPRALAHPGCVIVPVTLSVVEEAGSTGHETLLALALGFEVVIRVGLAVQPSMLVSRGFHETSVLGVFGAAVAAGRLLGLDAAQLAAALGIAGSHASGTIEYGRSGGEVKRLHAGLGAVGGVRAAALAKRGLTGPREVFEGTKGVLQAIAESVDDDALLADLGRAWEFTDLRAKESAAAATIHGPVSALRALMRDHGLAAGDIESLVVGVDAFSAGHLGTLGPEPRDVAGAQFSLHYSLGMAAVLGGNGYQHYRQGAAEGFDNPEILRIARAVSVEVDPDADAAFPRALTGRVEVRCADGRTLAARGSMPDRWDPRFVERKFAQAVEAEVGPGVAGPLRRAVEDLAADRPLGDALRPLGQLSLSEP